MKRKITLEVFVPPETKPTAIAILCHAAVGIQNDVVIVKSELVEEDPQEEKR